jgi:hypothetical protein
MLKSRTFSLGILYEEELRENDRIVLTRYDIGYRIVTPEVSTIVINDVLPRDLIYSANYYGIEEGYGDQWFVFNNHNLDFFHKMFEKVVEQLVNEKYYYYLQNDWPFSKKKNKLMRIIKDVYRNKIKKSYILNYNSNEHGLVSKVIAYLFGKLDLVIYSAETYPIQKTNDEYKVLEPLNIHTLIKMYVIDEGLNSRMRFLDYRDFSKINGYKIINQPRLTFLIFLDKENISQFKLILNSIRMALSKLQYNISIMVEDNEESSDFKFSVHENLNIIYYSESINMKHTIEKLINYSDIVYFFNSDFPIDKKIDEVYLNALMHYVLFNDLTTIELVQSKPNRFHDPQDFPNLEVSQTDLPIFFLPTLINVATFLQTPAIGDNIRFSYNNFSDDYKRAVYSVISSEKLENFYTNDFFHHVNLRDLYDFN